MAKFVEMLRYELRVIGPVLFGVPVAIVVAMAVLIMLLQIGHVTQEFIQFIVLTAIEACLPLALGIILATMAVQDSSLELLLTLPVSYRVVTFSRLMLVLGWTIVIEIVTTVLFYMVFPWVFYQPLLIGQLVWLAPTLWAASVGTLLALLLHSRAGCAAVLSCLWIIELAFHNFFAQHSWTLPWFFFATLFEANQPLWLPNRLEMILTALVL